MSFDALRSIAKSSTVGIDALGFAAHLKPADLQSLRKFIDVVGNGVRIREWHFIRGTFEGQATQLPIDPA